MRELVPIKVKIGLRPNGHADHPDFNTLDCVKVSGMDWAKYVDVNGVGWHYDKQCGHKDHEADSPYGMQWGVLIVNKEFADEAIIKFPSVVTKLNETELEIFYDNRAHKHESDIKFDEKTMKGIKLKQDHGIPLTEMDQRMLDIDDDIGGIRKNWNKTWKDYKQKRNIKIVQ